MNRASLSETVTSHRWQTIGQLVTFQQAAKTRGGERAWGGEERTKMICLARPSRWMKIEGTKKLGGGGRSLGYILKTVDFNVNRKHS